MKSLISSKLRQVIGDIKDGENVENKTHQETVSLFNS